MILMMSAAVPVDIISESLASGQPKPSRQLQGNATLIAQLLWLRLQVARHHYL